MKNKVIIIGSGLGGLQCGYILAKHGFDVTVLERSTQTGGCLQTFPRGGVHFDTGFHYVGGLDEGQPLWTLFRYFDLLDLPWHRLDNEYFDEVVIGGESFPFASGHSEFVRRLADRFPSQREGLEKYTAFLKHVGDHIFDSFTSPPGTSGAPGPNSLDASLFARSAYDFLCENISDPLLRKVLSGTSLKMQLDRETLPLYGFAQINNSFIQSAWRLRGGGSSIADSLVQSITRMGGRVITNSPVVSIETENGHVSRVVAAHGRKARRSAPDDIDPADCMAYEADWVISDAHPAATVALVKDGLRNIYRKRISSLRNTYGMFTVNILLKKDAMPYLNRNIYIHGSEVDLWQPSPEGVRSLLISYPVPENVSGKAGVSDAASGSISAGCVDLMTPMAWSQVEKWSGLQPGHRGEDYRAFKEQKARECVDLACTRLPQLRDAIDRVFTSTPLTYSSYLAAPQGNAYGLCKDWRDPMSTVLTPLTPVEGLLMTGQSLNLHGILGVSMTSVFTCASILGMPALSTEILQDH